jgi:hypothetical protein
MGPRLLACIAVSSALALAACQPLYGNKPDKLVTPSKKKKPPEVEGPPAEVKYVEECNADFRDDPKKAHPQSGISRTLTTDGDTVLASSDKAKEDTAKVGLIKEAIEKYRNALIKDPYNVEATLKLAIAYDKVLRKGCAIAMLKRLAAFSNNPKWAAEANRNIDAIDATPQWFKGYRKDAMSAVGR